MEREITRNDFGQIVSYEITSSNLEYGKVFLEPFVVKFDEDSYNEQYPLPQRDEFELPFNRVFVLFDVTQVSFPAFQFQYLTSSLFGTDANPTPVWEMRGLSVENVGAANRHAGACNDWGDESSYWTFKPIWELDVGDYIFKDADGLTALVFMNDNKRMAFGADPGTGMIKRSFKLEKGTGKILDRHTCDGSGGQPPNWHLLYEMVGSGDGSKFRSSGKNDACRELELEEVFYTQKIIYELEPGDFIYRSKTPTPYVAGVTGSAIDASGALIAANDVSTLILDNNNSKWKAFSADGYKFAFKLIGGTGRIDYVHICPGSRVPQPVPGQLTDHMFGKSINFNRNDGCNDAAGTAQYYIEKPIWELGYGDFVWNNNQPQPGQNLKWHSEFKVKFSAGGVTRLITFEANTGRIINAVPCNGSNGIPRPKGSLPLGKTAPDYTMWVMQGGNFSDRNQMGKATKGVACRNWIYVNAYYTLKRIDSLTVGDYIYFTGGAYNIDIQETAINPDGTPNLNHTYDPRATLVPVNNNNDWFSFKAGQWHRAFRLEVGTGKILEAEDC